SRAWASASGSPGGTRSAASPSVSRNTGRSLTTDGVPQAAASSGGRPYPSAREGITSATAPAYRASRSRRSAPAPRPRTPRPPRQRAQPGQVVPQALVGGVVAPALGEREVVHREHQRHAPPHRERRRSGRPGHVDPTRQGALQPGPSGERRRQMAQPPAPP